MSRLLKRMSQKSLRKRLGSTGSESTSSAEPPVPKRTMSEPLSPLPTGTVSNNNSLDASVSPSESLGALTTSVPSKDDSANDLKEAWVAANSTQKTSKTDNVLQVIEDKAQGVMAQQENVTTVATEVQTVLEETGAMDTIIKGIDHVMEGSTVLMATLDEVAKIHPFIRVAVLVFKAAWTLEMTRRENNKKIIALRVEMKDMMAVLVQLKNIKDPKEIAYDGITIEGRMQELIRMTEGEIKQCTNACDTFHKKKVLVRVIKGHIWENRLLYYAGLFTKRRSEFEFSLTMHTAHGVDAANIKLSIVDKSTQEMKAKLDLLMKMFKTFAMPEEKDMVKRIQQRGGIEACERDEQILKELHDSEPKKEIVAAATISSKKASNASDFEDLKEELHEDPEKAMEKNMVVYSRKFEFQQKQITDEMSRVVRREGDRVISAITSGPHDHILDHDVHDLWKEMGWRGNVKTRHFVLALRDHFKEKWRVEAEGSGKPSSDEWTLTWLSITRLQPVSEAFDDDASGFITVSEVNAFTTSRPKWSLPHWVAFWAIGWHQSMIKYRTQIRDIIAKMFAILPNIKPANRAAVNGYLNSIYVPVTTMESSVNECYVNDALYSRFSSYVEAEEDRLRRNLETVQYDIDALDTLALVTGQGRIERFLLPLIYLLLERHFATMRICQNITVHPDELWDASNTIQWVMYSVDLRVSDLADLFKQQKQDVNQQFQSFANGLFDFHHNPTALWSPQAVKNADHPEYPFDDTMEPVISKPETVLNHPIPPESEELDKGVYDATEDEALIYSKTTSLLKNVLGLWNGYEYWKNSLNVSVSGMVSVVFRTGTQEEGKHRFQASGRYDANDFTISGECSTGDHARIIKVTFKQSSSTRFPVVYYQGQLDLDLDSIIGTYGLEDDPETHEGSFILKRTPAILMCFRPAPAIFEDNKARALWSFALSAVRYHVGKRAWSKRYFEQRRVAKKRFIELYIREKYCGHPLEPSESTELALIRNRFTAADSRFYHSLAEYRYRRMTVHDVWCDSCRGRIGGDRIICLICQTTDTINTVDFCDSPKCIAVEVTRNDLEKTHLPHHDLVKVRRVVFTRQFGKMDREAKEALVRARAAFKIDEAAGSEEIDGISDDESGSNESDHITPTTPVTARRLSIQSIAQRRVAVSKQTIAKSNGKPACLICKNEVTQPCWYCVECQDATWICTTCDAKGLQKSGNHVATHDLVRCQERVEESDNSVEGRIATLDSRFSSRETMMADRLGQMEQKFDSRLLNVDNRLLRVENLLESLLGKMGAEPPLSSGG